MPDMQVTESKIDELSREFTVTIPASDIEDKIQARLNKLAATMRLPGFRPGKVPLTLLRKRYGASLRSEVLEETINETSQSVMTDRSIRPALPPRVEVDGAEENADLQYTLAVELLPEIEQPDFSGITLERLVAEPEEAEVQATVERIAEMVRGSHPVEESRPSTARGRAGRRYHVDCRTEPVRRWQGCFDSPRRGGAGSRSGRAVGGAQRR
ncbi:MAG: hypothetical protein HC826_00910 [Rhodospirillales bacterium]|nr:hypothetical protein [Rhodospirillales bacterium]